MALKPDRNIGNEVDISYFMNHVCERGGIVVHSTSGSGAAMDQSNAVVVGTGNLSSGTLPAGLLLNDMVNKDLTQTHINVHKDEVQLGGKVAVLRRGVVVTNVIDSADEPGAGSGAFYTAQNFTGGLGTTVSQFVLTTDRPTDLANATDWNDQRVGTFLSGKDEDGYAKVEINLP